VSPPLGFELDKQVDTGAFKEAATEVPRATGWLDVLSGFDSGFEGAKDLRNRRRASDIAMPS